MTKPEIVQAIKNSWNFETSKAKVWDDLNPALGQCSITAVLVQEWLGGDILRINVLDPDTNKAIDSHYYNLLEGDEVLDLTIEQFRHGEILDQSSIAPRTREQILASKDTRTRYLLLKERVDHKLGIAVE